MPLCVLLAQNEHRGHASTAILCIFIGKRCMVSGTSILDNDGKRWLICIWNYPYCIIYKHLHSCRHSLPSTAGCQPFADPHLRMNGTGAAGTSVVVVCDPAYVLSGGPDIIRCTEDGTWSPAPPSCVMSEWYHEVYTLPFPCSTHFLYDEGLLDPPSIQQWLLCSLTIHFHPLIHLF